MIITTNFNIIAAIFIKNNNIPLLLTLLFTNYYTFFNQNNTTTTKIKQFIDNSTTNNTAVPMHRAAPAARGSGPTDQPARWTGPDRPSGPGPKGQVPPAPQVQVVIPL